MEISNKKLFVNAFIAVIPLLIVISLIISTTCKVEAEINSETTLEEIPTEYITDFILIETEATVEESTELIVEETTEITITEPVTVETEPIIIEEWNPEERDIIAMAKLLWGECRGVKSKAEQAAVAWCVLNRFDSPCFSGATIYDVITAKYQFAGYNNSNPVTDELRELAEDVLNRWHKEQLGEKPVGRTLPKDYYYFVGKNGRNWFSTKWKSGEYFDFSALATNPYNN